MALLTIHLIEQRGNVIGMFIIKKVQNIVFKVVARASEAQIAIKAIKLHFQRAFAFTLD